MKTILVPIDFSKVTDSVVAEAAGLARCLDARLILLHVTEPKVAVVDFAVVALSVAQVNEAAVKSAAARLEPLQRQIADRGVPAEIRSVSGLPAEEIPAQASALGADYVVIGSHGHRAIYDVLVGSTTSGVLKRAACPVVVVPAGLAARQTEPGATAQAGRP
jgi:nucleotide-binding universal stress UspA family protein